MKSLKIKSKIAVDVIAKNKADYLLIDTCDCRNGWYQLKANPNCRIVVSPTSEKTISEDAEMRELFERVSIFTLTDDEWKKYVDEFCALLLTVYDEEHIILNEFKFAETYLKDGETLNFDRQETYRKLQRITDFVANLIKEKLPKINVISAYDNPKGNYYHHLGCSNLHYLDEVYLTQAEKLDKILNM